MNGHPPRHNPLQPLEVDLARGSSVPYPFRRRLARSWGVPPRPDGRRRVFAASHTNLSFRRMTLEAIGGFDESMRLGAEHFDACMRTPAAFGDSCLVNEPSAIVRHHFLSQLRDSLQRSRSYGRGQVGLSVRPHGRSMAVEGPAEKPQSAVVATADDSSWDEMLQRLADVRAHATRLSTIGLKTDAPTPEAPRSLGTPREPMQTMAAATARPAPHVPPPHRGRQDHPTAAGS